nr:MAG TPA: hypothetical protein [Caudoviricetes sp.]
MANKFLTNINLLQNELQNAVIQVLATDPATGKMGQIYYNSADKALMQYDGTKWNRVGVVYQQNSTTGAVITGLDASGNVTITNVTGLTLVGYTPVEGGYVSTDMSLEDAFKALDTAVKNAVAGGGEVNQNAWSNINVKKQSTATTAVTGQTADTTIAATAKTDTFSVASGNKWVDINSDGKQINIGHNLSGATAGTYGDGTHVAKVAVDEAGHVTSAEQVAINFPEVTVPVYDIVKDADSGEYAAIYHLTKDGTNTGAAINIPKDLFVKSGEVVDNPTGQPAGKYIKLTLQNQTEPIYINVADLVDAYTAGNGITISATNVVSAKVVEANGLSVDASGIAMGLASADTNGAMSSKQFTKLGGIDEGATKDTITLNGTVTKTPSFYAPTTAGTEGQQLVSSGTGAPTWQDMPVNLKKYTATNGAITAVGGAFIWTITAETHGVTTPAIVQLFEVASNEQVIADVVIVENGNVTITINGTGSLAAGTYRAVIIG